MSPLYHSIQPSPIPAASGVYKIVNTINGKFYLGSTTNLLKRRNQHFTALRCNTHHSVTLQHAWNKYTESAFIFEIIELVLPPFLREREQYWLDRYKPWGKRGYNIARDARASSLGRPRSETTKRKIAKARTGKTYGPETRERIRLVTLGHPVSANLREKQIKVIIPKVSKPRKPIPRTLQWNENIRLAKLGHDVSPESRERMRLSHLGQNLGYPVSAETRTKIRETKVSTMQTLIVTSPDGEEFTVTGVRHFCIQHNLHQSAIMRVAKGKATHHHGWTARFP